jgi:hypothetical protein
MERRNERQLVCGKRRCRNALQAREDLGRYRPSSEPVYPLQKPIKPGTKTGHEGDRPWRIAAGRITAGQYHCATVADWPQAEWADGQWQRTEKANRALLQDIKTNRPHVSLGAGCVYSDWKPVSAKDTHEADLSIPDSLRR